MTYSAYVQQFRLDKAEKLLISSTDSIESIAEAVGYHNKGYFYKIFQEKYGVTPSRYRKENTAIIEVLAFDKDFCKGSSRNILISIERIDFYDR